MRGGKKIHSHWTPKSSAWWHIFAKLYLFLYWDTAPSEKYCIFSLGHSFQMWGITTAWNAASAPASAPATQIAETKTKMKERFTSARMVKGTRTFHRFVLLDSNTIAAFKLSESSETRSSQRVCHWGLFERTSSNKVYECVCFCECVYMGMCAFYLCFLNKKDVLWRFVSFLLCADHWAYQTNKIRHLQRTQCCVRSLT